MASEQAVAHRADPTAQKKPAAFAAGPSLP